MHDPETAIICDKCGKSLRSQTNLKKHHELEHSEEPRAKPDPVQCEICGTWLRHLSGLKQHMNTVHEPPGDEHRCPICNKTSTNSRALKRHIYHNHQCERKFKCGMCEKAFKRPQDLRVSHCLKFPESVEIQGLKFTGTHVHAHWRGALHLPQLSHDVLFQRQHVQASPATPSRRMGGG